MEGLILREDLHADPFSSVFEPGAVIAHSIMIVKLTDTMSHVVRPLSLISLTFDVSKFSIAVGVSQIPRSLVSCSILELHGPIAMAEPTKPLALVHPFTCLVSMLSLNKVLGQLGLIAVEE